MKKKLVIGCIILICLLVLAAVISICNLIYSPYDIAIDDPRDGKLKELEDAIKQLEALKGQYKDYYDNLSNEEKLIVDAYNNGDMSNMGCINKYYCTLENGAIVVDMGIMHSHADDAITEIKIADLIFSFPNTAASIEVLYNGEFLSLSEAYENGIVSYDELVQVHNIHNNK